MSIATEDKIYLFADTRLDLLDAIHIWFRMMKDLGAPDYFEDHFTVTVEPKAGHHFRRYWRACLFTRFNVKASDDIVKACQRFAKEHSKFGIAHYNQWTEGREDIVLLGLDEGWALMDGSSALEWYYKREGVQS